MEKPDLLPCPFCGGAAEFVDPPKDKWQSSPYVECTRCGLQNGIRTVYHQENAPAEVVIKRWNTRATLGPENQSLPTGKLNVNKLDNAVLALLALNINSPELDISKITAPVELNYESMVRLHQSGMLAYKPSIIPERGVYLSEVGARRAHELFRKLFCD